MNCTDQDDRYFLTNVALGIALSIPFMRTPNPLGVGIVYSAVALPLHLVGLTPSIPLSIGFGLMGRAFGNISPLAEFAKKGDTFLSTFTPFLKKPLLLPAAQFFGGICITKFGIEWSSLPSLKKACRALKKNALSSLPETCQPKKSKSNYEND